MRLAAPLAVALLLGLLPQAEAATAAELCERLFVPEGYTLTCETRIEAGLRSERAVVRPSAGAASLLAELTLRPLDRAKEPLAWQAPDLWLKEQVQVDVSGISSTLRTLSGTGPLAHPAARATVDGLITMLAGWSQLPLQSCTPDDRPPARHELRCRWGVAPLALEMAQRLVIDGERRWAVSYWATDEQRLRHLEAIANSFAPQG